MHQQNSWQNIAQRVMHEQDSQKLIELTQELIYALEQERMYGKLEPSDEEKNKVCEQ